MTIGIVDGSVWFGSGGVNGSFDIWWGYPFAVACNRELAVGETITMSADDTDTPTEPEPVPGVRKSAAVHIHPVADPDAWRHAVLPDPATPKTDTETEP